MTTQAVRHRSGWVTFAGVTALLAGAYNALSGLSTVTSDYAAVERAHDVLFTINVDVWGWFWLIVGSFQLVTGVFLLRRHPSGLWLGVAAAGLSATMAVFAMFAWPLWAFAVLTLDLLVLYGLIMHGED